MPSLAAAHQVFLEQAVELLSADRRVDAVLITGSAGRGEQDEWSDLDIGVVSSEDQATVLASPSEAERFGDLGIWVDCSFNAPIGGTMAFSRYLTVDGLVLVDWHVWPAEAARATSGTRVLWTRSGVALSSFDGTVVDLVSSRPRRTLPPYSRQQRAEWELCMAHIAIARPARHEDATPMLRLLGVEEEVPAAPAAQLDVIERHVVSLQPWVAPRIFGPSLERIRAARLAL